MTLSRVFLLGALVTSAAGCHDWYRTQVPAPAGSLAGNPSQVRVTLTNGISVVLRDPMVSADSLFGSTYMGAGDPVRLGVPLAQVKSVDAMKFTVFGTIAMLLGLSLVILTFLGLEAAPGD